MRVPSFDQASRDELHSSQATSPPTKHEKQAARVMIEIVRAINRDFLPRVESDHHDQEEGHAAHAEEQGHAEGPEVGHAEGHEAGEAHEVTRVTCMTCHRGQPEPRVEEVTAPPAPSALPAAPEMPPPGAPPSTPPFERRLRRRRVAKATSR